MSDDSMSDNPSVLSHVSIGTNDLGRALAFYDRVLATIGCRHIMEHPGAVAYGKVYPELWVQTPLDGAPATIGNGTHVAFVADGPDQVRAFYEAALAAGGRDDGPPGPRAEYSPAYHGCFVRDPDGHKIEATHWDPSKAG